MAFPSVANVSEGVNTGAGTSHVVNLPANLASGNLLVMMISNDGVATLSEGGGNWSQPFTQVSNSSGARLSVFAKVSNGGEGANVTITSSASEQTAWVVFRITDWAGALGDLEFGAETSPAASAAPDPASLNPTGWDVEDALWIAVCGWNNNSTLSTYPSGYGDNNYNQLANTAGGCGVAVATKNNAAASEDPGAFAISASELWIAVTAAVRPAAAAGAVPVVSRGWDKEMSGGLH